MDQSAIDNRQSAMLVQCVPNFSEGRNPQTIERVARAIGAVKGALVLDRHIDPDHNRSVITFVAPAEAIIDAALAAVATAAQLIDLRDHAGEHPRIGATDVLPFVPLGATTIEDCVTLAHAAGQRIWSELRIPVYFYERAAMRSDRTRGGLITVVRTRVGRSRATACARAASASGRSVVRTELLAARPSASTRAGERTRLARSTIAIATSTCLRRRHVSPSDLRVRT